jgi:hypothetical protein
MIYRIILKLIIEDRLAAHYHRVLPFGGGADVKNSLFSSRLCCLGGIVSRVKRPSHVALVSGLAAYDAGHAGG